LDLEIFENGELQKLTLVKYRVAQNLARLQYPKDIGKLISQVPESIKQS